MLLYLEEVLALLAGQDYDAYLLEKRHINYKRQLAMSNFPGIICGRFMPEEWEQSGAVSGYYRFGETNGEDTDGKEGFNDAFFDKDITRDADWCGRCTARCFGRRTLRYVRNL